MHRVRVRQHSMLQSKSEGQCCCWKLAGNKDDIFWMVEMLGYVDHSASVLTSKTRETLQHMAGATWCIVWSKFLQHLVIAIQAGFGDVIDFFVFELKILVKGSLLELPASVFHLELRRNAFFFKIDGSISPADANNLNPSIIDTTVYVYVTILCLPLFTYIQNTIELFCCCPLPSYI